MTLTRKFSDNVAKPIFRIKPFIENYLFGIKFK